MTVEGSWTNQDGESVLNDANSTVIFGGASGQAINTAGSVQEVFGTLRMNKSANDLTLNAPIRTRSNLDLQNGRIFSTSANVVSMDAAATTTNATDASFVHGPVEKSGTANFTFPIGKNATYRPASLTGITGIATDGFVAEYFQSTPQVPYGNVLEPTLDHISDCEYWIIDRLPSTTADAFVTLSWNSATSCGVTLLSDLRVARYDALGSIWRDRGNGGTTGTTAGGTVITAAQQTLFSPWTLASVSGENPLPVELLWFTATPSGDVVDLDWTTATEIDNDYFTVERSADAINWLPILEVNGAGNSQHEIAYSSGDQQPLSGLSYYRLRQTDFDGTSSLSQVVPVMRGHGTQRPLTVFSGDGLLDAWHGFTAGSQVELLDLSGRVLMSARTMQDQRLAWLAVCTCFA